MDIELQEEIMLKYDGYFRLYWDRESNMKYGFQCADGWAELIEVLMLEIHDYITMNNLKPFQFLQVKEKFGALRIYVDTEDFRVLDLINKTEALSTKVCEYCGMLENVGMTTSGWMHAICRKCFIEGKTNQTKWSNKTISDFFKEMEENAKKELNEISR